MDERFACIRMVEMMKMEKKIILASNSPRRRQLLEGLGIPFEVKTIDGIDESYPDNLPPEKIAEYIANEKAQAYVITPDELLITADTIVVCDGEILGKPHDEADARRMLKSISGKTHKVITGVCLLTAERKTLFSVVTDVTFKMLTDAEISYYISNYAPYDKAGAYGIQEWIGYVGVTSISGSYFNVMGLPVQRIYEEIKRIDPS